MFEWKLGSHNELICPLNHVSVCFPQDYIIKALMSCSVIAGTGIIHDQYDLNDKNLYNYTKTFKTIHCYNGVEFQR